jgi:hypothetical protein
MCGKPPGDDVRKPYMQLVQYAQATHTSWPVLAAGMITAAYVGLVVGILLYVPHHKL